MNLSKTRLAIEVMPTNPQKPTAIGVFENGKLVAVCTLEEFDHCAQQLAKMRVEMNPKGTQ